MPSDAAKAIAEMRGPVDPGPALRRGPCPHSFRADADPARCTICLGIVPKRVDVAKSASFGSTPGVCTACGNPYEPRPGEKLDKYNARQTCSRRCAIARSKGARPVAAKQATSDSEPRGPMLPGESPGGLSIQAHETGHAVPFPEE